MRPSEQQEAVAAAHPPAPPAAGCYRVILADPPWRFVTWSAKGKGRSPEAWYDCLDLEAIVRLPVGQWAAADAVLFLWVTDPLLERAFEVIRAWGFTYKTVGFHWVKLNPSGRGFHVGLGYWTRANSELCLLATRGAPRRSARDVERLVVAPRREHSRKPEAVQERIERLLPGPYLELFARARRPGWDAWGLEVGRLDGAARPVRRWPAAAGPAADRR